jgi:hypothetical protein
VICLWVWLALFGHAPSLTSSLSPVEVEALPSNKVLLSLSSSVLWPPPTSHPAFRWTSLLQLIPAVTVGVDHRPDEISPVPSPAFTTSRSPYAGGSFGAALPGSSHLPWPSLSLKSSAPSCSPLRANISTLQACPELAEGIHFMLRAAVLLPFPRGLHRFSTSGHPEALDACYVVSWQLPRPDLRRLADDSFRTHQRIVSQSSATNPPALKSIKFFRLNIWRFGQNR